MFVINSYYLRKLSSFIKQQKSSEKKYFNKLDSVLFCFMINWLFFGIWQIIILSSDDPYYNAVNWNGIIFLLFYPMTIISSYTFCILPFEINQIINKYSSKSPYSFSISYIIFILKWHSLFCLFGTMGCIFFGSIIYEKPVVCIWMTLWWTINIGLVIEVIQLSSHIILRESDDSNEYNQPLNVDINEQKLVAVMNEDNNKLFIQVIQSEDDTNINKKTTRCESCKERIKHCLKCMSDTYIAYKYWITNIIAIGTCLSTLIGAISNDNEEREEEGETALEIIAMIAGACLFLICCTICSHHNEDGVEVGVNDEESDKKLHFAIIDNKWRMFCIGKTTLLLVKQFLIKILSKSLWDIIFSILSLLSLIVLVSITYGMDNTFVSYMIKLNITTKSKKIYSKYVISYIITNIASFMVIIASIINAGYRDKVDNNHDLQIVSNLCIFGPFIWLYFAKLYNNEFVRFKQDIKRKKGDKNNKSIPSTIESLYHFENTLIISCVVALIGFGYEMIKRPKLEITIFTPLLAIQMVFPFIIIVSMLVL